MVFLTLHDDPFTQLELNETALLERVRSVARRDADDRTFSELLVFQDALERLGMLWTPFDCLYRSQCLELVRNLHLELSAPGDVIYLKHSPAMRSYVVLRGRILVSRHVLDREGTEGTRVLEQGDEFGIPLDPDRRLDDALMDFGEYAKTAPADFSCDNASQSNTRNTIRVERTDWKAELLCIRRQDWGAALQCSRAAFARMIAADAAHKDIDPLKDAAREVFEMEAKGRSEESIKVALQYLVQRVPFCRDIPSEQARVMARSLELRGLTVPGRVIFRRGRKCFGEAYVMFTGTADQRGVERAGDRLIKEGDFFGGQHFGAGIGDKEETKIRTATAVTRTAPCELLVLPARQCQRLKAFVAVRNSRKALGILEQHFHNMPSETREELSALASFRKLTMHEQLATAGDEVSTVFFVFRGECKTKPRKQKGGTPTEQRFGPGHIVGWPYLLPESRTSTPKSSSNKIPVSRSADPKAVPPCEQRRPRRHDTEWKETCVVATPAQVLSVPRLGLLHGLSVEALSGLRQVDAAIDANAVDQSIMLHYIAVIEGASSNGGEQASPLPSSGFSDDSVISVAWKDLDSASNQIFCTDGPDLSAYFGDEFEHSNRRSRRRSVQSAGANFRAVTAPDRTGPFMGISGTRRPRTTPMDHTRWRWRKHFEEELLYCSGLERNPSTLSSETPLAPWGSSGSKLQHVRRGSTCCCPVERCRVCSASHRLERFHQTPPWTPLLQTRSDKNNTRSSELVFHPRVHSTHPEERFTGSHGLLRREDAFIDRNSLEGTVVHSRKNGTNPLSKSIDNCTTHGGLDQRCPRSEEIGPVWGGNKSVSRPDHCPPIESRLCSGADWGVRQTGFAANAAAERRAEQRIYTILQLSRRPDLDPCESTAGLCMRLLGSFETEAKATTRVLNLYHTVLPSKLAWRPFHRTSTPTPGESEISTDCIFLLRKGSPVQWITFDVRAKCVSEEIMDDEGAVKDADVGKGYDQNFPAVFKAKWQTEQNKRHKRLQAQGEVVRLDKSEKYPAFEGSPASDDCESSSCNSPACSNLREERIDSEPKGPAAEGTRTVRYDLVDCARTLSKRMSGLQIGDLAREGCGGVEDCETVAAEDNSEDGGSEGRGGTAAKLAFDLIDKELGHAEQKLTHLAAQESGGDTGTAEKDKVLRFTTSFSDLLLTSDSDADDEADEADEAEESGGYGRSSAQNARNVSAIRGEADDENNRCLTWLLSRLGMLEKVEGCYETEAIATKKGVKMLDEMVTAIRGEHITINATSDGQITPLPQLSSEQLDKVRRVCVLPLYQWLSLGDGGIQGLERALRDVSIGDFPWNSRAGLNTDSMWTDQRARILRSNLYNMLRAAGPREIRRRCLTEASRQQATVGRVVGAERWDGDRGGRDNERVAAVAGVREDRSNRSGDLHSRRRDREKVQAARDAVLRQNQKLIHTEIKIRKRMLAKAAAISSPEGNSLEGTDKTFATCTPSLCVVAKTGVPTERRQDDNHDRRALFDDASLASMNVNCMAATGESVGVGARQRLRIQMNIERKRARLFDEMQTLPYTGVEIGRQGGGEKKRATNVIRPAARHFQTRLHGRPISSIFAKLRAAAVPAPPHIDTTTALGTDGGGSEASSAVRANSTRAPCAEEPPPPTGVVQAIAGGCTSSEAAPLVVYPPHTNCAGDKTESALPSLEKDLERSVEGGSSGLGDGMSVGYRGSVIALADAPKSTINIVRKSRRGMTTVSGKGGRHVARKTGDHVGDNPVAPCSLDGELLLLDGVLHDARVKSWVETSLGPPTHNKRL